MTDIYPYANLTPNPDTSTLIYWIDNRDGTDGSEQTFDWDEGEESSDGTEIEESDAYLYGVEIDGLSPDTEYSGTIDGEETVTWRTLPSKLDERDVTVLISSDWHNDNSDAGAMDDPEEMQPLADTEPDIAVTMGDYHTWEDEVSESAASAWLRTFDEYYGRFDRLPQIIGVPGNHEVGNHQWDGTTSESVNPDEGYYSFFYKYPRELDGPGNSGAVTVGDYLQILCLDTHSAYPEDVGNWLEDAINEGVPVCIPVHHSPYMQLGNRDSNDLRENMRLHWAKHLAEADNIAATFAGHTHVRGKTVPWTVEDEDAADSFDLGDDGYLVEADTLSDGVRMWGDGYRADRSPLTEWWVERASTEKQFYSVEVSNPSMTVNEFDEAGNLTDTETYFGRTVKLGDVTLGDVQIGTY